MRWVGPVVLIAVPLLLAGEKVLEWHKESITLTEAAANCPKDIDVELGGKFFRLPIVNNLTLELADENIRPEGAKSLRPLRGEFRDNGEYPVVCGLAQARIPTPITSFGFSFDEVGSLERVNEQLSIQDFCKNPQEYGAARLCKEGFIKGNIEPSRFFLSRPNGSRYHPYMRALKLRIGEMSPEEKPRMIRRIGNVTEVKCCGTSDISFYIMPPSDAEHFDEMSTIMQCTNFDKNHGSCMAYGTFSGANLNYSFASPLRPTKGFEELNSSVRTLLERLQLKQ